MLDIRPATPDDAAAILALRHTAEDWLADRGIDQWRPREVPLSVIESQVAAGEFVVARLRPTDTPLVAAMRLIWSDEPIWLEENAFAGYVHHLVVDRSHSGRGIGRELLDWAERTTHDAGASVLRLDCVETNPQLRAYYARLGFREVGRREFRADRWLAVTLFERDVLRREECRGTGVHQLR
ncbi:GNAT family N-acetyltransferase [Rhodococcoides yunnanense]|uniref:GNAT family N-acetyltransferase n=1 Tax=Rhodococcoides yunnanense TaxID=278209 RepID=UPI0009323DB0|nr:GNAT family N-acetyltransferase [Rhodococcus yunnanensis]